jgi:hypothetical protein
VNIRGGRARLVKSSWSCVTEKSGLLSRDCGAGIMRQKTFFSKEVMEARRPFWRGSGVSVVVAHQGAGDGGKGRDYTARRTDRMSQQIREDELR